MTSIESMKQEIIKYTSQLALQGKEAEEPWNTVSLCHGSTTRYLNDFLNRGITPRKQHQHHNFSEHPSNENLVYLTSKWHYWYAFNANQESLIRQVGKERYENENIENLWNETGDFPMYLVCEIPVELLTLDEDVVYQHSIKRKIHNGEIKQPSDISVEECLHQGTVGCLTPVDPLYINEIIIIGSSTYRDELLNGQYGEEASKWFKGLGIGSLTAEQLSIHEILKYREQIHIMGYEYPASDNPTVASIKLVGDELQVKTT